MALGIKGMGTDEWAFPLAEELLAFVLRNLPSFPGFHIWSR